MAWCFYTYIQIKLRISSWVVIWILWKEIPKENTSIFKSQNGDLNERKDISSIRWKLGFQYLGQKYKTIANSSFWSFQLGVLFSNSFRSPIYFSLASEANLREEIGETSGSRYWVWCNALFSGFPSPFNHKGFNLIICHA